MAVNLVSLDSPVKRPSLVSLVNRDNPQQGFLPPVRRRPQHLHLAPLAQQQPLEAPPQ
jgi:hypothetical protein